MITKKNAHIFFLKKAGIFLISIFVLSLMVFYISRLAPGDPLVSYYGDRVEKMTPEERDQTMERLGLNETIIVQYGKWLLGMAQGDFGISFKFKQPVADVISGRFENTLILGGIGFVLTFGLSLLLGIACAWNEGKWIDKVLCQVGTVTSCIPEFWFSLVLILLFCVIWRVLPSSGAYSIGMSGDIGDRAIHLILPMIVVVMSHLWYYAYMIRNKLLEEIRADYVLLAKSKGLPKREIMFKHCLRNVLPTYISIMAISVPHILGGTYIVETVFSYPGIGMLSYESAKYHDYNLLMLLCMITGIIVIFCNLLGQAINEHIDPRIKATETIETSEVQRI